MAADLLKFLFKSKFLRKYPDLFSMTLLILMFYGVIVSCSFDCYSNKGEQSCQHGKCVGVSCECFPGWTGKYCQFCSGRLRLENESGIISDGFGNYTVNNQCTWLIDPGLPNSFVRIYLNHFSTECSWDHLYIYDGGSVYDPLLGVFSGMIVKDHNLGERVREIVAKSGKALVYFYSDPAYNSTGFSLSYRVNGCPRNATGHECSGRGVCIDGDCTCNAGWTEPDCSSSICPSDCFGNGDCSKEGHQCQCHEGYTGKDCSQNTDFGWWEAFPEQVTGFDSTDSSPLYDELQRTSHSTALLNEKAWIAGGYSFSIKNFLVTMNFADRKIQRIRPSNSIEPTNRYGHSSVVYEGLLYIFGGAIIGGSETMELWSFNPNQLTWKLLEPSTTHPTNDRSKRDNSREIRPIFMNEHLQDSKKKPKEQNDVDSSSRNRKIENKSHSLQGSCLHPSPSGSCTPLAVVGHAAVVVEHMMLGIFGYSSTYGLLSLVQEYHFKSRRWKIIETEGAVVSGTYGHTATWDPKSGLVYVHGGLISSNQNVLGRLLIYEPFKRKWSFKRAAPIPRFLHSAFIDSGLLFVFGGNNQNDTSSSYGAKCFSDDFFTYDIHCDMWHSLSQPPELGMDVARYGHTAVMFKEEMVVLGGFNGQMLGSSLHYHLGSCDGFISRRKCLSAFPGRKCVWNRVLERCELLRNQDETAHDFCPVPKHPDLTVNNTILCSQQTSCQSCLFNSYSCVWCSNGCSYEKCNDYTKGERRPERCENKNRWWCKSLKTCNLCHAYQSYCSWQQGVNNKECISAPNHTVVLAQMPVQEDVDVVSVAENSDSLEGTKNNASTVPSSPHSCPVACNLRSSCVNCTQGCLWCFNLQRCVNGDSYLVSFPYGQCREWATEKKDCPHLGPSESRCRVHQTCDACHKDIACGWCDDGTGTGTGGCMEGGQSGPVTASTGKVQLSRCQKSQWFFTSCPACNCNGHSHCVNDSVCVQPCANNTEGPHCAKCRTSFYGKPINGGLCKPCHCNNHGLTCEPETGVCHCHTKGVTGDHCERCDTQNNYYGEPLKGSCFYDLQIDYQFTFNLSKQEDLHIRQINFYNVPSKPNVDTDFDIQCSKPVRIKISARQTGGHETWILKNFTGMSVKRRFTATDYVFGSSENNTTFHVYVFNFTPPIEIIISFSQHPKLDLIQFFSIFSLCFMVLLLLAFVMWKIKQKYDMYTRRQRLMVEMEAMASRPFCSIYLELQKSRCRNGIPSSESLLKGSSNSSTMSQTSTRGTSPTDITLIEKEAINGPIAVSTVYKKKKPRNRLNKRELRTNGASVNGSECPSSQSNSSSNSFVSNGVATPISLCNGSAASIHPPIALQSPDKALVKSENYPSPISLEPCGGNKAAVLSLLIELPTGGTKYTSPGHPGGLAVASTLVSLGPPPLSTSESSFFPREVTKGPAKKVTIVRIREVSSY